MSKLFSIAFAFVFLQTIVLSGVVGTPVVLEREPQVDGIGGGLVGTLLGTVGSVVPREVTESSVVSPREPQLSGLTGLVGGVGGLTGAAGGLGGLTSLLKLGSVTKLIPGVPALKRSDEMD